jgi:enamine deaminase RidA (YjgF/YER057c/UK114 family)
VSDRRSIYIEGLRHLTAIPVASRVGPLVMSSVIAPFDPGTRDIPDSLDAQLANIFTHVGKMLQTAGATWEDVVKMDFWIADPSNRAALDGPWVAHFPDEARRPARHTHTTDATFVSADFTAYVS